MAEVIKKQINKNLSLEMDERGQVVVKGISRKPISFNPLEWSLIFQTQGEINTFAHEHRNEMMARMRSK